jgi:hypothetical protein
MAEIMAVLRQERGVRPRGKMLCLCLVPGSPVTALMTSSLTN